MQTRASLRAVIAALIVMIGLCVSRPAAAMPKTPLATCILPAKAGMAAAKLFENTGQFDCRTSQARFGSGDFWVLSQRLPDLGSRGANIRYGSVWMSRITLYVRYADGVVRQSSFSSRTASQVLKLGAVFSQRLPPRRSPPIQLLWHVEGSANFRGVILGPSIVDDSEGARTQTLRAALYGAFAGMAIALIVYNLALWGALRQAYQPAYCLLVLCLLAYAATSSGAIAQVFPGLDNNDRQKLSVLLLASSATAALMFARTFFERAVFAGWLRTVSNAVMAALMSLAVVWGLAAPVALRTADTAMSLGYLALMLLIPVILWRAWRVRSNYLWLFALAWGAPIVMAGLRVANSFGLIGWRLWLDNSTILAMAIEALLSSIAIAYRILLLSRERDAAREKEIEARLLADTDPLTGLLNRRAFLSRAIGRTGEQVLLIVDIDHFKRVNETIGHDGGDEVLRVFARALRSALPPETLVARVGGEEFAVVGDAATSVPPNAILERIRREPMPYDVQVTASIGCCTGPLLRETDWKLLYREADRALFAAKAAGRDRARHAIDHGPSPDRQSWNEVLSRSAP